jgi:hypothetical protein
VDLRDRAEFAYLDWIKTETTRLTEIARQQCYSVLECKDPAMTDVEADPERGKIRFKVEGLEFEVLLVPQARQMTSNTGIEGIHDDEVRIAFYACINWHDYRIETLADLGKRLAGVVPREQAETLNNPFT